MLKEGLVLFFSANRRWVASIGSCLAGILVLAFYFLSAPNSEDYLAAEESFVRWSAAPQEELLYRQMKAALKKTPDLEKKYRMKIAQKLLEKERVDEALAWAGKSLKQFDAEVPFHSAYGETTLFIEKGEYQQALEQAVHLKESMLQALPWMKTELEGLKGGLVLYAHNLLRIASLQQHLNNRPGEKAAWEEFERFMNERGSLAGIVYGNFREKGVDLSQYILERKRHL